jgi:GTP cyclohydrolase II
MFAYLDPSVRQRLIAQEHLMRINMQGARVDSTNNLTQSSEPTLDVMGPIPLPIALDDMALDLSWYPTVRSSELSRVDELASALRDQGGQRLFAGLVSSMAVNSVLMYGDPLNSESPLVRVHSSCLTGDVFGSQRCECGPQFVASLDRISTDPAGGIIVYMAGHEGRGIGLWAKAAAYLLQDAGEDTYQANRSLGLPDDSRDFRDAAALLLHFLGNRPFRLMTNNPSKEENLRQYGLDKITRTKHVVGISQSNKRYMAAKRDWGHQIATDDLD